MAILAATHSITDLLDAVRPSNTSAETRSSGDTGVEPFFFRLEAVSAFSGAGDMTSSYA